jgi:hypothetical protein
MAKLPDGLVFSPAVTLRFVTVPRATMEQQTDALNRLRAALDLPTLMPAVGALPDLQKSLDAKRGKVTAVLRGNELVTLLAGEETAAYGVAFEQLNNTPASMRSVTVGPSTDFYYAINNCISDMLKNGDSVEDTVDLMDEELNGLLYQYLQNNG